MNLKREEEQLRKTDLEIAAAHQRVQRQEELIRELGRDCHSTTKAVESLKILRETLRATIDRRRLIVENIDRIKAALGY